MKKIIPIISLFFATAPFVVMAQTQKNNKTPAIDTSYKPTKQSKLEADANNYVRMSQDAKAKFKTLFPSRPGDTVYVVIPGINYTDPNLKLLKQNIDDIKSTKGLTSTYRNNTTVVKVVYKGGDASKLYDNLSDAIKELFLPEDIEGTRLVLTYKQAKPTE
jgi:hypothetical protein